MIGPPLAYLAAVRGGHVPANWRACVAVQNSVCMCVCVCGCSLLASLNGHVKVAGLLLAAGAGINERCGGWCRIGASLLCCAVCCCRNAVQASPLHRSAYGGHTALTSYLLEKGADLAARNKDGWTPVCLRACVYTRGVAWRGVAYI